MTAGTTLLDEALFCSLIAHRQTAISTAITRPGICGCANLTLDLTRGPETGPRRLAMSCRGDVLSDKGGIKVRCVGRCRCRRLHRHRLLCCRRAVRCTHCCPALLQAVFSHDGHQHIVQPLRSTLMAALVLDVLEGAWGRKRAAPRSHAPCLVCSSPKPSMHQPLSAHLPVQCTSASPPACL